MQRGDLDESARHLQYQSDTERKRVEYSGIEIAHYFHQFRRTRDVYNAGADCR